MAVGLRAAPARLILVSLVVLLPLLPPETRGESMAGCAALIAILAALRWLSPELPGRGEAWLVLGLVLAVPVARASMAPGASVLPIATLFLAGAVGLHAASLPRPERMTETMPAAVVLGSTLVSLYALVQKLWGLEFAADTLAGKAGIPARELVVARLRQGRAFAGFATPAALGGFLALALPVTVGFALGRRGRARAFLLLLAAIEGLALVASASATAAGALMLALALSAVAAGTRRPKRLVIAAGLALALLVAVVALRGPHLLSASSPESPWKLRFGNYRSAWEMARDHPWAGVGPGNFGEVLPQYLREGESETRYAHDLPLQLAAEVGIPAAVVLGSVFFWLFLVPALRRRDESPLWVRGTRVGLAAFALHNLADFTAFLPSMLWLASALRGATAAAEWDSPASPGIPIRRAGAWLAIAGTVVAAAVAASGGLSWNARMSAREALAAHEGTRAAALGRRSVSEAPWDADARLVLAAALLDPGSGRTADAGFTDALDEVETAVRLSPVRAAARELRARLRLHRGDAPGAYADLCEAVRLHPGLAEYATERDRVSKMLPRPPGREDRP